MADEYSFLNGPAVECAQRLLGCYLIRKLHGRKLVGKIVETEAYDQTDAASHSYKGRTPRTEIMYGPSGHLYVYFTYGIHYCMNVVCGPDGVGAAVLIRAVEPLEGEDSMQENRGEKTGVELTNGPAKVCYAFAIDKQWNGHDLHCEPFQLQIQPPILNSDIIQTTRVGISQAKNTPWRFYFRGNPYVSRI